MTSISFIVTYDILHKTTGSDHVLCRLAGWLTSHGYQVQILTPHPVTESRFFPLSSNVKKIHYASVKYPIYLSEFFTRILACLSTSRLKRHFLRQKFERIRQSHQLAVVLGKEPDTNLIVAMTPVAGIVARLALQRIHRAIPIVAMVHSSFEDALTQIYPRFEPNRDIERYLKMNSLWRDHLVILREIHSFYALQVLQKDSERQFKKHFPNTRIIRIPNAVPQYLISSKLESKRIVYVSRLDISKRHELLIRAFSLIRNQFPDWVVEFWGSTENSQYATSLKALIERENVSNCVFLRGETKNIDHVLLSAAVFVIPSAREGFSLAMTEAMAIGLPVLGCVDAPGVRDLILDGKNGLLCEPTAEAMSAALSQLMKQLSLRQRLGAAAQKSMSEYAPEKIYKMWEDVFKVAMKSSSSKEGACLDF